MRNKVTRTTKTTNTTTMRGDKNMKAKNIAVATKNIATTNTTTKKGANTMKNDAIYSATVVTLEKDDVTVDFVQFHEGTVMYIVNKIPTMLMTDIAVATIKQYINDGWKKTIRNIEEPKEKKTAAPKEPKTPEEKKLARDKYLTEKYGDIDSRRTYAVRHSEIWNEESAKIAEDVKNGKRERLSKSEWKKEMNMKVDKRMVEEGFTLVR